MIEGALSQHGPLHGDGHRQHHGQPLRSLGMALRSCAAIPAPLSERLRMAEASGRRIVGMVQENLKPSRILSPEA